MKPSPPPTTTPRIIPVRTENNYFQHAEVLKRNREKRTRYKEFLVEGVIHINRAIEFGWTIKSFLYSQRIGLSDWAKKILGESTAAEHLELTPELLEKLSEKEETSELLAIVEMKEDDLSRISVGPQSLIMVFDRPGNPGNLGASIRSCDAFGCSGVIVTGHAADIYHPQTVRGSMGALFSTPVVRLASQEQLLAWRDKVALDQQVRLSIVGSSAQTESNVDDVDLTGPLLLVMGNETWGMSKGYKESCDTVVRIPIGGSNSSINVSCAASIILYEAQRQRRKL